MTKHMKPKVNNIFGKSHLKHGYALCRM